MGRYFETRLTNEGGCGSFALPSMESGVTIYVDDDNIDGPWEGTFDHPYQNITSAFLQSSAEDTIYVRRGLYHESLAINRTVSIVGEETEETVVDGSTSSEVSTPVIEVAGEAVDAKLSNLTIRGSSDYWGIVVTFLAKAWIENTKITNNSGGVLLNSSNNNTLINNTIVDNKNEGVLLLSSSNNLLRSNTIDGNKYNFGLLQSSFDHDIDTSNSVEGKPIFYLRNQTGLTIDPTLFPSIGYLALINCRNTTVNNLSLHGNYNGLLLAGTQNSTVKNNSISDNLRGIDITNSLNNVFEGNSISDNGWTGVTLDHAANNQFRSNNLLNNTYNLMLEGDLLAEFIQDVDISNTVNGKPMYYLINQTDIAISPSTYADIGYLALVNCNNVTVESLVFENNEVSIAFTNSSIIKGNTLVLGGMSVSYCQSLVIIGNSMTDGEIGLLLYRSNASRVQRNTITDHNDAGIVLRASSNNTVFACKIDNDTTGIELTASSNNIFSRNNITRNRFYGVVLVNSSYNLFYHNNFINDIPWQVVGDYHVFNSFDNGYPAGGNYWPDYSGNDTRNGAYRNETGSDGMGDTVYAGFFGVTDRYPLMKPIQDFETGIGDHEPQTIGIISNSTIFGFSYNESQGRIGFKTSGPEGSAGFCRIVVPNNVAVDLWSCNYSVVANGETMEFRNWTDALNTYLYFDYLHPQEEINIVPEYSLAIVFSIIMLTSLLLEITLRKAAKHTRTATEPKSLRPNNDEPETRRSTLD